MVIPPLNWESEPAASCRLNEDLGDCEEQTAAVDRNTLVARESRCGSSSLGNLDMEADQPTEII